VFEDARSEFEGDKKVGYEQEKFK